MRGRLYVLRHTYICTVENLTLYDEGKIIVNHPLIDEGHIIRSETYVYTVENHPLIDEGKIMVNHPLIDEGKIIHIETYVSTYCGKSSPCR